MPPDFLTELTGEPAQAGKYKLTIFQKGLQGNMVSLLKFADSFSGERVTGG
jgi:hypothetical protein